MHLLLVSCLCDWFVLICLGLLECCGFALDVRFGTLVGFWVVLEFNWLCFVWVFNSVGICFHFSLLYVFWFVLALVFEFVVLG